MRLDAFTPVPSHHLFSDPKNTVSEGTTAEILGPLDVDVFGSREPQPAPGARGTQGTLARALGPR